MLTFRSAGPVAFSSLQVYNEVLLDSLGPLEGKIKSAGVSTGSMGTGLGFQRGLPLRWTESSGFFAEGLTREGVESATEALRVYERAAQRRVTASHSMNSASSRSHSIFTMDLKIQLPGMRTVVSRVTLVDLAGSERLSKTGATGGILDESIAINTSLFNLRKCIQALSQGATKEKVPYRDSKLTSLLKQSVGGNAATLMVACLNPCDDQLEETISTLHYASQAGQIVNSTRVNLDPKSQLIASLRAEVSRLRDQIRERPGRELSHEVATAFDPLPCQPPHEHSITGDASLELRFVEAVGLLKRVATAEAKQREECAQLRALLTMERENSQQLHEKYDMLLYLVRKDGPALSESFKPAGNSSHAAMAVESLSAPDATLRSPVRNGECSALNLRSLDPPHMFGGTPFDRDNGLRNAGRSRQWPGPLRNTGPVQQKRTTTTGSSAKGGKLFSAGDLEKLLKGGAQGGQVLSELRPGESLRTKL